MRFTVNMDRRDFLGLVGKAALIPVVAEIPLVGCFGGIPDPDAEAKSVGESAGEEVQRDVEKTISRRLFPEKSRKVKEYVWATEKDVWNLKEGSRSKYWDLADFPHYLDSSKKVYVEGDIANLRSTFISTPKQDYEIVVKTGTYNLFRREYNRKVVNYRRSFFWGKDGYSDYDKFIQTSEQVWDLEINVRYKGELIEEPIEKRMKGYDRFTVKNSLVPQPLRKRGQRQEYLTFKECDLKGYCDTGFVNLYDRFHVGFMFNKYSTLSGVNIVDDPDSYHREMLEQENAVQSLYERTLDDIIAFYEGKTVDAEPLVPYDKKGRVVMELLSA